MSSSNPIKKSSSPIKKAFVNLLKQNDQNDNLKISNNNLKLGIKKS